ncbi:hypothetical protein [Aliivibrio salmonicida]|uniref:hypothetical protein n=1 Tax=Aliivibrio salmonicida TaxID=40269 RepID=UPI003D13570A
MTLYDYLVEHYGYKTTRGAVAKAARDMNGVNDGVDFKPQQLTNMLRDGDWHVTTVNGRPVTFKMSQVKYLS